MTKFAGRCGVQSRPDHPGGQCSVRRARLMGPGVFLALCGGRNAAWQCHSGVQGEQLR